MIFTESVRERAAAALLCRGAGNLPSGRSGPRLLTEDRGCHRVQGAEPDRGESPRRRSAGGARPEEPCPGGLCQESGGLTAAGVRAAARGSAVPSWGRVHPVSRSRR